MSKDILANYTEKTNSSLTADEAQKNIDIWKNDANIRDEFKTFDVWMGYCRAIKSGRIRVSKEA